MTSIFLKQFVFYRKLNKSYSKFFQSYYPTGGVTSPGATPVKEAKVRVSPSHDDLKAMIAQAHRSVYRCVVFDIKKSVS